MGTGRINKRYYFKLTEIIPVERITSRIYLIRGVRVMLDRDLAELYGVETRRLNEQVRRNIKRFPDDFMFQLDKEEFENLKSHFVISSWGGTRKLPLAFTECVAMLSSVLNSNRAIQVNIQIMRAFSQMRKMLLSHKDLKRKIEIMERKFAKKYDDHDKRINLIFKTLKKMILEEDKSKRKIGFEE
jgi:hypothetical protein